MLFVEGTYSIASVTYTRQGTTDQTVETSRTTYTIVAAPYTATVI